MRWLRSIFGACAHKWKLLETVAMTDEKDKPQGKAYVLQCEHCGELRVHEVRNWSRAAAYTA